MRPWTYKLGPMAASDADGISVSQTPTSSFTITGALASGGVATMDIPRRVLFTTAADESAKTATITGETFGNTVVTDVVALANAGTSASAIDFKKVTAITISSAAAGAITVGTNGTAGSPWFQPDPSLSGNISVQVTVSGTVNYTVQQTLDDPNVHSSILPYQMDWENSADTDVVSATATKQSNYLFLPSYARVFLNSQTNPGYVTITWIQTSS